MALRGEVAALFELRREENLAGDNVGVDDIAVVDSAMRSTDGNEEGRSRSAEILTVNQSMPLKSSKPL